MRQAAFALSCALLAGSATAATGNPYPTSGTCDGLPRIAVTTAPGYCLGLVASGLNFPRGVLPLADGGVLVAAMGGWSEGNGAVWQLTRSGTTWKRNKILSGLDRPHGIAAGPDGRIYVGAVGRIFRFRIERPDSLEDVIGGKSGIAALPGTGRHPLTSFVFDRDGNLLVNVGSFSDNCENPDNTLPEASLPCPETQGAEARGVIRKYVMTWPEGRVKSWSVLASGLRNSVALAAHAKSGTIMQAENSRDAIHLRIPGMKNDEELPHDELNVIEAGANYGWPLCYDNGIASPEFPQADCSKFRKPLRLLPAHAAPLGMTYAKLPLPGLTDALVISYHGYRKHGHRIVAFPVDSKGMVTGNSLDLINGWDKRGTRPAGSPVDVRQGVDGAFYITEDRNGTVLKLVKATASN